MGSKAFIDQRFSNRHGCDLALAEYDGSGRRAFIILLEGQDRVGFRSCVFELQTVLSFFQVSCGARVKVWPPHKRLGHLLSSGIANTSSVVEGKALAEGSEKKLYAKALVTMGQLPKIAIEPRVSVGFSNFRKGRCGEGRRCMKCGVKAVKCFR